MADPRELAEQAFALLQDALRDSETRVHELSEELSRARAPGDAAEPQAAFAQQLAHAVRERDTAQRELARTEDVLEAERAKVTQLKRKLDTAEGGPDKLTKKEINYWRSKGEEFDQATREYKARIAELRRELAQRDELLAAGEHGPAIDPAAAAEQARLQGLLSDRDTRVAELAAEAEQLRAQLQSRCSDNEKLTIELDAVRQAFEERDGGEQITELEDQLRSAAEQIAGLEHELREEKECVDNLSEVANERRELITNLEDRLAEAEERYEEARWRLGKAQHFERLVKRRKKLIRALLDRIRQKHKANVALKAGLDSLRRFKATAEARQHELLGRIDKLTAKVKEGEETIAGFQGTTQAKQQLLDAEAKITELDKRVGDQIEIIQTLEEELKTLKAQRPARVAEAGSELDEIRDQLLAAERELEAKATLIARLEEDAGEQQRKLAKLRGSDSETTRLRSQLAEQETTIARLNEAVDGWKRKYEFMSTEPAGRRAAEQ